MNGYAIFEARCKTVFEEEMAEQRLSGRIEMKRVILDLLERFESDHADLKAFEEVIKDIDPCGKPFLLK